MLLIIAVFKCDLKNVKLNRVRDENIVLPDGSSQQLSLYRAPSLTIADCKIHDVEILVSDITMANFLGVNVLTRIMPFTVTPEAILFHCPTKKTVRGRNGVSALGKPLSATHQSRSN